MAEVRGYATLTETSSLFTWQLCSPIENWPGYLGACKCIDCQSCLLHVQKSTGIMGAMQMSCFDTVKTRHVDLGCCFTKAHSFHYRKKSPSTERCANVEKQMQKLYQPQGQIQLCMRFWWRAETEFKQQFIRSEWGKLQKPYRELSINCLIAVTASKCKILCYGFLGYFHLLHILKCSDEYI